MNELHNQICSNLEFTETEICESEFSDLYAEVTKKHMIDLYKILKDEALEVLNAGVGNGFLALLAAELGHKVTVIDSSNILLHQLKKNGRNKRLLIKYIEGITNSLPLKNNFFDVVTTYHKFLSLEATEQTMSEWNRVLLPGGHVWAAMFVEIKEDFVSVEDIEMLLVKTGFADIKVKKHHKDTTQTNPVTFFICAKKAHGNNFS